MSLATLVMLIEYLHKLFAVGNTMLPYAVDLAIMHLIRHHDCADHVSLVRDAVIGVCSRVIECVAETRPLTHIARVE